MSLFLKKDENCYLQVFIIECKKKKKNDEKAKKEIRHMTDDLGNWGSKELGKIRKLSPMKNKNSRFKRVSQSKFKRVESQVQKPFESQLWNLF